MKQHIILFFFLFTSTLLIAQDGVLEGEVRGNDDEILPFALISVDSLDVFAEADENGNYSLELPYGRHLVQISIVGYNDTAKYILLDQPVLNLNFNMKSVYTIDEVEITGSKQNRSLESTQMSTEELSMETAKKIPALLGEVDIIKTIQLKPGISSGGEGSSSLNVRGGTQDQNLFLFDGATIYNASHLFGFFSTFNSDAVKGIEVYKGGFPAKYGGRLSSVLDVEQLKGSKDTFDVRGGLGLIASRLSVSGPIVKDKLSFLVSGRRTYVDLFTDPINEASKKRNEEENEKRREEGRATESFSPIPSYYFYDLNGGLSWQVNDRNTIELSTYLGKDEFGVDLSGVSFSLGWGNLVGALRWKSILKDNWSMNTAVNTSNYNYKLENQVDDITFDVGSKIRDLEFKNDHLVEVNEKLLTRFGVNGKYLEYDISQVEASDGNDLELDVGNTLYGTRLDAYGSAEYEWSDKVKTDMGLRYASFVTQGGTYYPKLEPRFSIRYKHNDNLSFKVNYTMMHQFTHLAYNSAASLPTDIWHPSTERTKPQRGQQVALGTTYDHKKKFIFGNEIFYKHYKDQIDFVDFADLFVNQDIEGEFVYGDGYSIGSEFYIEKTSGPLTGWIGYTLSYTKRQFDDINNGESFFPSYHKLHDLSVVAIWEVSRKVSLSGSFIFNSGQYGALPQSRFINSSPITGETTIVPVYSDRDGFQEPSYNRMDLGLVLHFYPKWGKSDLTLSIYNTYNRLNPYFVYFKGLDANGDEAESDQEISSFEATQVSLFPIIPSITYNFKF